MMLKKRKIGEFLVKMFKQRKGYRIALYKKRKLLSEILCMSKRYALQDFNALINFAIAQGEKEWK